MSYKKLSYLLLFAMLFVSACSGRDDKTRLERKEVLYSFQLDESGYTHLIGRGIITWEEYDNIVKHHMDVNNIQIKKE
jgi:hypothetical protein